MKTTREKIIAESEYLTAYYAREERIAAQVDAWLDDMAVRYWHRHAGYRIVTETRPDRLLHCGNANDTD